MFIGNYDICLKIKFLELFIECVEFCDFLIKMIRCNYV